MNKTKPLLFNYFMVVVLWNMYECMVKLAYKIMIVWLSLIGIVLGSVQLSFSPIN